MAINSRDKGIRYEREVAHELKRYGFDCMRTAQHCGKPTKITATEGCIADNSDVIGLPGIHIECKHYSAIGFKYAWLKQAKEDCGENLPAVFHRIDKESTVVTMALEDWIKLYQTYRSSQ